MIQLFYWGYLQECGQEVIYRSREDPELSAPPKADPSMDDSQENETQSSLRNLQASAKCVFLAAQMFCASSSSCV